MCMVIPFKHGYGFNNSHCTLKGGDRVDTDGIPLYSITHWQKAQFLDHVCGIIPRITNTRISKMFIWGLLSKEMGS